MVNYFRAFRRFERLLFKGVPEHPEQNWEREVNDHAGDRNTGRAHIIERRNSQHKEKHIVIATVTFKPNERQIEIIRKDEIPQATSK